MVNEVPKPEITEDAAEEELAQLVDAPPAVETSTETAEAQTAPATAEKAEVAAKPSKKKAAEDDIVEEKTYTIPLGKALIMPPRKRAPRAMRMIRAYIVKHMKIPSRAEEEDEEAPSVRITNEINECVWGRGIEKPPRKIRVRATKDREGNVTVHLVEAQ
jgi:large subunit ribosomal protein L31e